MILHDSKGGYSTIETGGIEITRMFPIKINSVKMKTLSLVIEKSKDGKLWGRVEFGDELLVDFAHSQDALERKMKRLLQKFHGLDAQSIEFIRVYDLSALFMQKDYLNVSAIAVKAGINPGLMRQYVAGFKHPSFKRAKTIEKVINTLGKELIGVKLAVVKNGSVSKPKALKTKTSRKRRTSIVNA
jgi:hypothetical protein